MAELAPWALAMNAVQLAVIIFLAWQLDSANFELKYWRSKSNGGDADDMTTAGAP